jgi:SAM-dependent methyltransferase
MLIKINLVTFLMPEDKSLYFYGKLYNWLFDGQNAEARKITVELIPKDSTVLDIACGTGQLCFDLKKEKKCRVTGLDLSIRMLDYARKISPFKDLEFIHGDATDLSQFGRRSFDYVTMHFVLHELNRPQQIEILRETLRVAGKVLMIDSAFPMPRNAYGIGIRAVEATFGHDHYHNFKCFLSGGGINGIIADSGLNILNEYSSVFKQGCREVVIVSQKTEPVSD